MAYMLIGTGTHDTGHPSPTTSEPDGHGQRTTPAIVAGVGPALLADLSTVLDTVVTVVAVLLGVGGAIAVLALGVAVEYERRNMEATIDVTDDGVDVEVSGPLSLRSGHVFIPFEDIQRVEYTDSYAQVEYAQGKDTANPSERGDPDASFHSSRIYNLGVDEGKLKRGTVAGCVRVELEGEWPVYVGSDRYEELAATIAANAPRVGEATECNYDATLMP